jgi:hypothetical protein
MSRGLREVKHLVEEGWEKRDLLAGSLALSVLFLFACRAYGASLCVQQMPGSFDLDYSGHLAGMKIKDFLPLD